VVFLYTAKTGFPNYRLAGSIIPHGIIIAY